MISLRNLTFYRGALPLLENSELTVHAGQKFGIIGANGSGKSSLFALLRGELQADAGEVELPATWVIAHVMQETPALERSALDFTMDGDRELRELQQALSAAETAEDGHRIAELHGALDAIDGYSAHARAAELLHGLGFTPEQLSLPVKHFSGGWRMRLNLAQALMCRSDLLLLDEPTNHLDLEAVLWLEQWLRAYPGTLLLISHDRDFLDAVVEGIVHVDQQRLVFYRGNYSAFEEQRAAKLAQQQALYEKQQREIAHLQQFIDRFRAKATKAKQAQSRVKALARMEKLTPAHVDSPFHFEFREPPRAGNPILTVDEVSVGYGTEPVLKGVSFSLRPGDRIALLGPNGAGKSTLVKLLAGELDVVAGKRTFSQGVVVGYFAQHQLEQLDDHASPLLHLQRLDERTAEQSLRDFLGSFGFQGEQVDAPVGPFSGGEKARLVLALLVWQRPNLLLLDEPTNHLDLEMRHALTVALQSFEGALIVVSHDRHLLATTTDEFWLVSGGRVSPFAGDLDDYHAWLVERRAQTASASRQAEPAGGSGRSAAERKEQKRQEAERRKRLAPLRKHLERLDREIANLAGTLDELEQALAEPALYESENKARLSELLARQAELKPRQEALEAEWLEKQEELEALQAVED
ncbi:ABC transporter ATP-binding protein [Alkalilimnicola ehrlichii]|uniref:Probable ATP-binding protein YheS n=1 Tax=Alkalilimnicola ehrlichii TaxID=351052 RepID=A0A3E0WGH4_9GAMM|nr:ATP-binding cassette domain-containing protein [Alkalilimnicola ehrlichii]RFA24802.1 ABC transporter ATP-binding protein [Alkalilimnicola ehrlichii]RFA32060.1 ABC transporter ATP-binding protein [Alkalilimnicola ehrlichii]